ncbi:MAG: hypothetical protein P9L97_06680 [Candidatus Tenebribacter davisii]|nr:hypothetical protein [Candidatus Tenebribacter davisii]
MGNLQSLMIVLSIILVGISIAVGLHYYSQENINNAQQTCFSELNHFASIAKTWWNTPLQQGGGGKSVHLSGGRPGSNNIEKLGIYIGHDFQMGDHIFSTKNASYEILDGGENAVKFQCLATTYKNGAPINIVFIYNMKTDGTQISIIN